MKSSNASARIERSLRQRLLTAYRRDLPSLPERIIVGFSGGTDSLALATLLASIDRAIPSRIHLLYIDHRIRPESGEEAYLCGELAEQLGLSFSSMSAPEHPRMLHPNVGLEEAARRVRYEAFAAFWKEGDVIALAHHAGDQAETVLLHLLHGAGTSGIAGMRRVSEQPVPWWEGESKAQRLTIWRPLLGERRENLLTVVEQRGLTPLLDPSNDDTSLRRNAIRHQAIPALQHIEPTIEERLGTMARIAADEDQFLDGLAVEILVRSQLPCGGVSIHALLEMPVALARRFVRRWLGRAWLLTPTFDRVEALLNLARSNDPAAKLEIGEGLLAGCFGDALRAGTRSDLEQRAWLDAGLMLPLSNSDQNADIDSDTVIVTVESMPESRCAARVTQSAGKIGIGPVHRDMEAGDTARWNEWMRQGGVSPWIRHLVQAITIDGVVWWIPRRGDYDDADGGRTVRVVWNEQGQELN